MNAGAQFAHQFTEKCRLSCSDFTGNSNEASFCFDAVAKVGQCFGVHRVVIEKIWVGRNAKGRFDKAKKLLIHPLLSWRLVYPLRRDVEPMEKIMNRYYEFSAGA